MKVDNVGAPVTKQQWDYIHKMGDALRHSFENVTSVFAPSCISHSVLTKRDWQYVKINDVSIAQALHCWEQQPIRKNTRRNSILSDSPNANRTVKKMGRAKQLMVASMTSSSAVTDIPMQNKRRRRKKHRNKNRGQRKNKKRKGIHY